MKYQNIYIARRDSGDNRKYIGKIGKNIIKKFFSMGGISIFYRKKIKIYMSYFFKW
jgi:hypothetical protein